MEKAGTRRRGRHALPHAVAVVELSPLTDDEAARTVKCWLPHAHPFLLREICSYAGGNPLFIEEVVRSLHATGAVRSDLASASDNAVKTKAGAFPVNRISPEMP